jgi:two-component system, chemotaxis family, CheB/CheR fusion protein
MEGETYIIEIGASAGGLNVIKSFINNLPNDPGAAIIIGQHLLKNNPTVSHEIIGKETSLPPSLIHSGEEIMPNHIYVMPENTKLNIINNTMILTERPVAERINRAIDHFFYFTCSGSR